MHGGNKFFMDGCVSFSIRGRGIKSEWAEDERKNLDTLILDLIKSMIRSF